VQIQRALEEFNADGQSGLRVRIGVAAGEPVTEQDDLFGATVQQAARLCACAEPDCIVVSSGVHDLCRGKGIRFSDAGPLAAKGFQRRQARLERARVLERELSSVRSEALEAALRPDDEQPQDPALLILLVPAMPQLCCNRLPTECSSHYSPKGFLLR
jgi:hypothetical protein